MWWWVLDLLPNSRLYKELCHSVVSIPWMRAVTSSPLSWMWAPPSPVSRAGPGAIPRMRRWWSPMSPPPITWAGATTTSRTWPPAVSRVWMMRRSGVRMWARPSSSVSWTRPRSSVFRTRGLPAMVWRGQMTFLLLVLSEREGRLLEWELCDQFSCKS